MTDLATSRRFKIAEQLTPEAVKCDHELRLAVVEWESRETDETVRGVLRRALGK